MDQRLKEHINPKKFIVVLVTLFLLFGVADIFVSDFFIVPLAAFYALVLWFAKEHKLLCAILPLPVLAASFFGGVLHCAAVWFCGGCIVLAVLSLILLWQLQRSFRCICLLHCFLPLAQLRKSIPLHPSFRTMKNLWKHRRLHL